MAPMWGPSATLKGIFRQSIRRLLLQQLPPQPGPVLIGPNRAGRVDSNECQSLCPAGSTKVADRGDGKQQKPVRAGCRDRGHSSGCQAAWAAHLGFWVKPEADGAWQMRSCQAA